MALTVATLSTYTRGRLAVDDAETARVLSNSVAAVTRWCGWHVAPVLEGHEVKLDGRGGQVLRLPTLKLVELTSVVEDGVELALADLDVSDVGMVAKKSGAWWSSRFGSIVVTMDHGFEEAPDFDAVVLSFADRSSKAGAGGTPIAVGPFRWADDSAAAGSAFTQAELSILEKYQLEPRT